jgi:cytoskeletal protein RodZ
MARVRVKIDPEETPPKEVKDEKPPETKELEHEAKPAAAEKKVRLENALSLSFTKKQLKIFLGVLAVLILLIIAIANRERDTDSTNSSQQQAANNSQDQGLSDAKKYEEEIGKIVDLPTDIIPTFSRVNDAQKLSKSSPVIFKNAQNDDVFLVYINPDKTAKVVLYRPSTKKVITFIDGVNLGDSRGSQGSSPSNSQ